MTAEVVVSEELGVHRPSAVPVSVSAEAGSRTVAAAPLSPGRGRIGVTNPGVTAAKGHSAIAACIRQSERRRYGGHRRGDGAVLVRPKVQRPSVGVEIRRPPKASHTEVHAEQGELAVSSIGLAGAIE